MKDDHDLNRDRRMKMPTRVVPLLFLAFVLLFVSACRLPLDQILDENGDLVGTSVARTVAARSQGDDSAADTQTEGDADTPRDTEPPMTAPTLTATPGPTDTPTQPPTATLTPTPDVIRVGVTGDTFCRTGPGDVYDSQAILNTDQTAEILAQDPTGGFWYITNPDGEGECWIWGNYATPEGPTDQLPVFTPPPTPTFTPTPTPQVAFNVAYFEIESCVVDNILEFTISNTGNVPLESVSYSITDQTEDLSENGQYNVFQEWNHCPVGSAQDSIAPGGGNFFVGYGMDHPNLFGGHQFSATITACTQDNLGGRCATRNLSFTAQ